MKIKLDPAAASAADAPASIDESGKYIGQFQSVYLSKMPSGSESVTFMFVDQNGARARLQLWITKRDGSVSPFGWNLLQSCLMCMKIREIEGTPRLEGDRQVEEFHQLVGKPVGLLLQRTFDENNERYPVTMEIVSFFEAATELTATEIKERKKEPVELAKRLARLKAERRIPRREGAAAPASAGTVISSDDDVPF